MRLTQRVIDLQALFSKLLTTSGRNSKEAFVEEFRAKTEESQWDDLICCFELLAGWHVFGFTYEEPEDGVLPNPEELESYTLRQVVEYLKLPIKQHNLTRENIAQHTRATAKWYTLLAPLVNKSLRLGIGAKYLPRSSTAVMKAFTFPEAAVPGTAYAITEKLNGTRTVAFYDFEEGCWKYESASGKARVLWFAGMNGLPKEYRYDGETLTRKQADESICRTEAAKIGQTIAPTGIDFNSAAGLSNRTKCDPKTKGLVFNVFDIMDDDMTYAERRQVLDSLKPSASDVRILPVIAEWHYDGNIDKFRSLLEIVSASDGEGIMLNDTNSNYSHERSNAILKYKKALTMDIEVVGVYAGLSESTKNTLGGLNCRITLDDGRTIVTNVGSGITKAQREEWWEDKSKILGKIVEVQYQSISKSANADDGFYSLQFPVFIRIRDDKKTTSQY